MQAPPRMCAVVGMPRSVSVSRLAGEAVDLLRDAPRELRRLREWLAVGAGPLGELGREAERAAAAAGRVPSSVRM